MYYDKWDEHWIMDLLSQELIDSKTFDEWMWCPERYSQDRLDFLRKLYNGRKNES